MSEREKTSTGTPNTGGSESSSKTAKPEEKPDPGAERIAALEAKLNEREKQLSKALELIESKAPRVEEPEEEDPFDVSGYVPKTEDLPDDLADPDKFADLLSTKGPKAVEEYLKRRGFMTGKDAAEMAAKLVRDAIKVERRALTQEMRFAQSFPELNDPKSELTQETARVLRELVDEDPSFKKSPGALIAAARLAKANLALKNKGKTPDDAEERRQRRKAQADVTDGWGGGYEEDGDPDELTPMQKRIAEMYGVTEDDYRKHAKQGVNIRGSVGRRAQA